VKVALGTSANAPEASGLAPFLQASSPPVVKMPQGKRSRPPISSTDSALVISAQLTHAF
jgi:hypothetical protein